MLFPHEDKGTTSASSNKNKQNSISGPLGSQPWFRLTGSSNRSDIDSGVEHWQLVRLITDLTFYFSRVYFAYDLLTIPIQNGVKTAKSTSNTNNKTRQNKWKCKSRNFSKSRQRKGLTLP